MNERDWLAERFETDRPRLNALAYRVLGSPAEADDAVRETWIRLSQSDTSAVENLSGWLTTIVARVSLNMLQSRKSLADELADDLAGVVDAGAFAAEPPAEPDPVPAREALLADAVGVALLVVLDTLTSSERLAFVLHDIFAVPFEEIAPIVDCSPAAAQQLAGRARRRVQRAGSDSSAENGTDTANADKADLVRRFLDASHEADLGALLAMVHPDIVVRADRAAVRMGGVDAEIRGADAVTHSFAGRVWNPRPALIEGAVGLVWAQNGQPRVAFSFTIDGGRITEINIRAELTGLDIAMS